MNLLFRHKSQKQTNSFSSSSSLKKFSSKKKKKTKASSKTLSSSATDRLSPSRRRRRRNVVVFLFVVLLLLFPRRRRRTEQQKHLQKLDDGRKVLLLLFFRATTKTSSKNSTTGGRSFLIGKTISTTRSGRGRLHFSSSSGSSSGGFGGDAKIPTFLAGATLGAFIGGFASLFVSSCTGGRLFRARERFRFRRHVRVLDDIRRETRRDERRVVVEATPVREVRVSSRRDGRVSARGCLGTRSSRGTTGERGIPDGR